MYMCVYLCVSVYVAYLRAHVHRLAYVTTVVADPCHGARRAPCWSDFHPTVSHDIWIISQYVTYYITHMKCSGEDPRQQRPSDRQLDIDPTWKRRIDV